MTSLNRVIYRRKSTRKYHLTSLSEEELSIIKQELEKCKALDESIKVEFKWKVDGEILNMFPIRAPHYLVAYSEHVEGYELNVGFIMQQFDLRVQALGYGAIWLGLANVKKQISDKDYVIMLGFGKSIDKPYRELSEFKRKPLSEIMTPVDERFEVVRLAPSSTNSQPWYLILEDDICHVYQKELKGIKHLIYRELNKIDMGIALAHLFVSFKEFEIIKLKAEQVKGYKHICSVRLGN